MALHQPLVPVFPVARELFSKTKFMARKGGQMSELQDGSAPRRSLQGARRDGNTAMPPSRPSTPNLAGEHIVRTMTPEPIESRNRIMRLLKRPKKNADPQESQEVWAMGWRHMVPWTDQHFRPFHRYQHPPIYPPTDFLTLRRVEVARELASFAFLLSLLSLSLYHTRKTRILE
jgi:hypothetical protein